MSVNTQLVTVTVDAIVAGTPAGSPATVNCVLSLGDYSQERSKTEYACMSSDETTVGLGSITRSPLNFELLYNEDAADGQKLIKTAFENNTNIQVDIEFDNAGTTSGTTLTGAMGVSNFTMAFPKDGKIGANFTLEFMEKPTLTEAV